MRAKDRAVPFFFLAYFVSCLGFLLVPVNVAAETRLQEAKILYEQHKYFEALKLVSPCLKATSPEELPDLEECLYFGNSVGEKAMIELNKKKHELNGEFSREYQDYWRGRDNWRDFYTKEAAAYNRLLAPYKEMGITPIERMPEFDWFYNNEFFKRLKELFPNSKHLAECEYILLNNSNVVCDWRKWLESLSKYIEKFSNSKYAVRAKLDLAYNYDDLWDLMHPDHDWSRLVVTFPKDEALANDYKQKALQLYGEILEDSDGLHFFGLDEGAIKERIVELKDNKTKSGIHILRCYD